VELKQIVLSMKPKSG